MATNTPCSLALACTEDELGTPEHDSLPGHSEFDAHIEDWYRDPNAGKRTPDGRRRRRALERCWNECPVRTRLGCLEAGLAQPEQIGIWGGYTESQREEILAHRQT